MTSNQRRAITLAGNIRQFRLTAADLTECDWALLLLAAGLNNCRALPPVVAQRVLDQADRSVGYFATSSEDETAMMPNSFLTGQESSWPQDAALACAVR